MTRVLKQALPPIVPVIFCCLVQLINTYFIGHLGNPVMLAGTGIGNIAVNLLCISIYMGMNVTIETLVREALSTGNLSQCTAQLNRGRAAIFLTFIPLTVALYQSD